MSNSLDQDPARHCVGPDLSSNYSQRSSADEKNRQRVNQIFSMKLLIGSQVFRFVCKQLNGYGIFFPENTRILAKSTL